MARATVRRRINDRRQFAAYLCMNRLHLPAPHVTRANDRDPQRVAGLGRRVPGNILIVVHPSLELPTYMLLFVACVPAAGRSPT